MSHVRRRVARVRDAVLARDWERARAYESELHAEVLAALGDPLVAVSVRTVTTLARAALETRDAFLL